ncbi:MAG: hypothetical protein HQL06_08655 [Nitrospirae bacterium]|nr:hypothetical protein [Nitrospirota bacterium]
MAGYIFNLDSIESLELYISCGIYATKLSAPVGIWKKHHEATFADYATMKQQDNIYFFIDRKIYGIGELVNIESDCKFSNFPEAGCARAFDYTDMKDALVWDEGGFSVNQRWLCCFKPSPFFFSTGVDMDDILSSNPSAFRMLRAFWKVSFLKFDDVENQAFKDVLLKYNQHALSAPQESINIFKSDYEGFHKAIVERLRTPSYSLDVRTILGSCAEDDYLKHEMAIEAGILYQLSYEDQRTLETFGRWDYLSHQVVASPFKPIDYMDKMDLFGYAYIKGFEPTRSKYLVGEIKKAAALPQDIEQLLKYVDWVKDEYAYGDYDMIHAFLVAYDFDASTIVHKNEVAKRRYTIGRRPAKTLQWDNLKLIKYCLNSNKIIDFETIS